MKKRISVALLAVLMMVSLLPGVPVVAVDDGVLVRLHYYRPDGDYTGWEVWLWDMDGITVLEPPYAFTPGAGGRDVVCEFWVRTGTGKIGYVIRKDGWTYKDVNYDQHINITGVMSGTVDFYVEAGIPTQSSATNIPTREELITKGNLVLGDDATLGTVVISAKYGVNYRGQPEVDVNLGGDMDSDISADDFQIWDSAGNSIPMLSSRSAGTHVYLVLGQELDFARTYRIRYKGRDYEVKIPNRFQSEDFLSAYTYNGSDLGAAYTREQTRLRVWAPLALEVSVNLYQKGDPDAQPNPYQVVPMEKDVYGTWVATLEGDLNGVYYTYTVNNNGVPVEACDPYARTTGVNGKRAMIIDLDATDPEGWSADSNPHAGENITDAIIYEVHLRDISTDASSGISSDKVGKYLGLVQCGTHTPGGVATGLEHIVDLGVTHVQLSPVYDFNSVKEDRLDDPGISAYNWGYDPMNYNVPEGSYSSDPYDGFKRVEEMKQMVKGLHDAGLSVIMDVVYNHVYDSGNFCFNKIVPGYFSRPDSNGSGCGNDTASELVMVRKYIVDSVSYWATEYHIDGFRFDLAGLMDVDTVNAVMDEVRRTRPDVIFYGEGWVLPTNSDAPMCTQTNSRQVPGFAFFNDTIRNGIKGTYFTDVTGGYISGVGIEKSTLNACFTGMPEWCTTPTQSINYLSCHDGYTLFDHIALAMPDENMQTWISANCLGAAILLTSQGVPYLYGGEELLRSKPTGKYVDGQYVQTGGYDSNSYNAPDQVNSIKWRDLESSTYQSVYQYYKGLIAFRKAHPALRLTSANAVSDAVRAYRTGYTNVDAYLISTESETILVVFNATDEDANVSLPEGNWNRYVDDQRAGTTVLDSFTGSVCVAGLSASVLVLEEEPTELPPTGGDQPENDPEGKPVEQPEDEEEEEETSKKKKKDRDEDDDEYYASDFQIFLEDNLLWIIIAGAVLLLGGGLGVFLLLRKLLSNKE